MSILIWITLLVIIYEIKTFRKELIEGLGHISYTNDLILMELKQI